MALSKRYVCALIVLVGTSGAMAGAPKADFTLGRYMPGDVWLYLHEIHNPERDYINGKWIEVFEAAAASGVDVEFRDLIASKFHDPQERALFIENWDRVIGALGEVPWCGELGAVEFAMGQRISLPMPNYILLFRNRPGQTSKIAKSMINVFETVASISESCVVRKQRHESARTWSLCISDVGAVCDVVVKDDVIGLTIGKGVSEELLALMSNHESRQSILYDPTFKRAMSEIEQPEDFVQYFRVTQFIKQLRQCMGDALATARDEDKKEVERVRHVLFGALDFFDVLEYSVWSRRTDGHREHMYGLTRLSPDGRSRVFGRALTDRKPFEHFDRFVPKEATGFAVTGFVDIGMLYNAGMEFVKDRIPDEGPMWMEQWAGIQEAIGFNLNRDLFSWLSGEMISVSMPGPPGTQMNGAMLIRTKDPELARQKVTGWLDKLAGKFEPVMVNPAPEVSAEGFQSVFHPMMMMMQVKPVIGVYEDWLVIGTNARDVNACLAVAKGEAPSIRESERFRAEGIIPEGAVCGASFTDLSKLGQEMQMMLGMVGMAGLSMPENEETKPIKAIFGMVSRLAPVVGKIDFCQSSASATQFIGDGWTHQQVLNYKPPKMMAGKSGER